MSHVFNSTMPSNRLVVEELLHHRGIGEPWFDPPASLSNLPVIKFTRMLYGPNSLAATRISSSTAAFPALY